MTPSRRRFLQSALGAPLAARLGVLGSGAQLLGAPGALRVIQGPQLFENPHLLRYDANCFTIMGRDAFIFSGAFHYPRCPRLLWRDRLLKLRQAGFNTIETYVFWNYHEPEEGRSDLSEFEDFVKLVKEMGFWMIVRPGPYVCAEWDAGGFPHWVIAKRFPLRSNHVESVKASQHWFNQVLPVIQRHQLLVGGPIIMMQLENEYDYWNLPDAEKQEYIRALAQMAWQVGISIPLITCWTKQVRRRSDPDMARITDTCNFYPRWEVAKEVPPALQKLRQEEPQAPLSVTELQGGWFSQLGGKLSVNQEGMNAGQLNLLTKTVIEQGVTSFNYYMGCGGTNFDRAAKSLTTTYDYAAPVREPGGLWDKYYAARGIGLFLGMFGASVLARARLVEGAAQSGNQAVSVTERINEKSAVLFVRENSNAEQHFKMSFRDPDSPTGRVISVPRQDELALGPREMKMLAVQVPIPGGQLRYSTAEVLAYGLNLDRHFLVICDEPGHLVEVGLATANEPRLEGDALYQYWDPEYETVVIGLRMEKGEKVLLFNDHLLVIATPRERALRTWTAEFPSQVVPGAEETKPMSVVFLGDSALLAGSGSHRNRLWADLDFAPGEHDLTVLLPPAPSKCRLDGALKDFQYDRQWRTARLHVTSPPLPYSPIVLNEVQFWVEKFALNSGEWLRTPLRPLEELGALPYGYVKYRGQFSYSGPAKMFVSTFADDDKKVFLNGKLVAEASNPKKQVEVPLDGYAQPGANAIEIAYELFGSPNFGANIGELKGVEYARFGPQPQGGANIDAWRIQRFPAAMRGRGIDPQFSPGGWQTSSLTESAATSKDLLPAFTWCRAEFLLPPSADGWSVTWKLTFEADRDALLYLNGKFVGRYVTIGPQKDFYLPEPYLVSEGKRQNILTIVLAYAAEPHHIRTLRVAPDEKFATRRTRVEFEW